MTDTRKKILIVDDTKSYLWILSQSFRDQDFEVINAENGEDGVSSAKNEKPDLILLDITMPKMDGITAAKKIREFDAHTPIIFLTNMSDLKHISEAAEAATDYIVKADMSIDAIVERVKEKLNMNR